MAFIAVEAEPKKKSIPIDSTNESTPYDYAQRK